MNATTAKSRAKRNTKSSEAEKDAKLEAIYQGVMTCEPAVPPEHMDALANMVFSKERVIRAWRAAALFGSKGGGFYRELSTNAETAKTIAPVISPMKDTAQLLREMADIMECVVTRFQVAGCNHERFTEWMTAEE